MKKLIYTLAGLVLIIGSQCKAEEPEDLQSLINQEIQSQEFNQFVYEESYPLDRSRSPYKEKLTDEDRKKLQMRIGLCIKKARIAMERAQYYAEQITNIDVRETILAAIAGGISGLRSGNPYAVCTSAVLAAFASVVCKGSRAFGESWNYEDDAHFYTTRADELIEILCRGYW